MSLRNDFSTLFMLFVFVGVLANLKQDVAGQENAEKLREFLKQNCKPATDLTKFFKNCKTIKKFDMSSVRSMTAASALPKSLNRHKADVCFRIETIPKTSKRQMVYFSIIGKNNKVYFDDVFKDRKYKESLWIGFAIYDRDGEVLPSPPKKIQ